MPVAAGAGDLDRATVAGHVATLGREPVREVERGVTERPRERGPQVRRLRRAAELDDEPGHAPAGQPPPHERRKHRDRHERERQEPDLRRPRVQRVAEQVVDDRYREREQRRVSANSTQVTSRR